MLFAAAKTGADIIRIVSPFGNVIRVGPSVITKHNDRRGHAQLNSDIDLLVKIGWLETLDNNVFSVTSAGYAAFDNAAELAKSSGIQSPKDPLIE